MTTNVVLTPPAEMLVQNLVASGRFGSIEEALEAALELLAAVDGEAFGEQSDEWWAAVRARIRSRDAEVPRARGIPADAAFFQSVRNELHERIEARQRRS